jgi:hypothetical protein
MSALICQRPSSIDRRDKRLGNGQAPLASASDQARRRVQFGPRNYLDALNASRVRIHRQKPKALGLKFSCGFTRHLLPSRFSGFGISTSLKAALSPRKLKLGPAHSLHHVSAGEASVGEVIE